MFVLNPYANRWKAGRRRDEAMVALRAAGIDAKLVLTERPGHGTELAYWATLDGFCPIIAAGGAGSISEVVNGVVRAADVAAHVIAAGKSRRIDLCQVNGRYFDNNSAIGLEPLISLIQQDIRRVRGAARYLLASLRGVMHHPS